MDPGSAPQDRRGSALVASVLAHLLVFALLAGRTPPPPPKPKPPPVTMEVRVVQRPAPVVAPTPAPVPPTPAAVPPPKPAPRAERPRPPAPTPVVAAPPPPEPPPAPPAPAPLPATPPPPTPDVPRAAAPDLLGAGLRSASRMLNEPGPRDGLVVEREAPPDAGIARGVFAPPQESDLNARAARLVDGDMGRQRVQRGLVDPYFTKVSRALAKGWDAEARLKDPNLEQFIEQAGQNAKLGLEMYGRVASNYGKTGSPLADQQDDVVRDQQLTDAQARGAWARKQRDLWRAAKRVLVRLTQSSGGLLRNVELVQPSTNPELDNEVLTQLRNGRITLPPPPPNGQGIHDPIRSTWAFTLVISISPPAPTISGEFDEVTGHIDVRRPLDRRVYKYVELISVE